ncbi:DNA-3-methyladenine glycosylase family protein [Butyrivibrio sp. YAB3001]|uniref:DNA-3-methyladenine glycosylase family protein n=1 Tax=Butyrivibrio sp. YAB3001 TaxID=1520812 RepID=UPI0008F622EF|nr:DNA glycosylase [Butyrivibrio sp. YAB3001]SFC09799.1 N-glycosylase/DNA lyase [Butyrivibrio sp. YAB3001]
MIVTIEDDFDLKKIADSGQCFRFNECADGYSVLAQDKYLFIKQVDDKKYDFSCSKEDYENFWKEYFDLKTDYRKIRGLIDADEDGYLYAASEYGKGIRILRQDPWEMLISFIISQRKNIPAIKASIEKICALCGKEIGNDAKGKAVYSFPTPEELVVVPLEKLTACSLGYRDKYVHQAALDVASGVSNVREWSSLDDKELLEKLLEIYGVGVKVANCEILFGFHRLDAFPKDVWINKVLELKYPEGFLFDKYRPYNGVMQQYLFFYSREEKLQK